MINESSEKMCVDLYAQAIGNTVIQENFILQIFNETNPIPIVQLRYCWQSTLCLILVHEQHQLAGVEVAGSGMAPLAA